MIDYPGHVRKCPIHPNSWIKKGQHNKKLYRYCPVCVMIEGRERDQQRKEKGLEPTSQIKIKTI